MNFIKRVVCGFVALGLSLAIAAPALANVEWDNGGNPDNLWSTDANWDSDAQPNADKTVIGELNYPSPAENMVTLNTVTNDLDAFEVYGGGVLNILAGGELRVTDDGDAEFGIFTGANGAGDLGSRINLLGGTIVIEDGVNAQFGDLTNGIFGGNGLNGLNVGYTSVNENGFTTFTGIPAAATSAPEPHSIVLALLGLGGLMMRRRRRRQA